MKLWQKENTTLSELVEKFTVGRDKDFDLLLAPFDIQASIAHARMLGEVGLMTPEESKEAVKALNELAMQVEKGSFTIEPGVEDVHSQIELLLTKKIGDTGKKIHSGRSRNDQVAVAIKLFLRHEIKNTAAGIRELFESFQERSEALRDQLLPGYTHLQVAMPSSFGLWLGAYAESLVDDLELLAAAYTVSNKNPLGSGAGYGSSFPLNRQLTTSILGFADLNYNSVYAQMTRGKSEKIVAMALGSVAATLGRFAMDCCLYLSQNFGFISFPPELTTGSSIMPHKKNPDVFEIIRARCNRIQSIPNELALLLTNLPSGYHRDLQLTKEILFPAFDSLNQCILMTGVMLKNMKASEGILNDPRYKYIFSVEAVNELVNKGIPFRDAYREVGNSIEEGSFRYEQKKLSHQHEGSMGSLGTENIRRAFSKVWERFL